MEIKIKCPSCSKVLRIQDAPNINAKTVACPACGEKHMIGSCLRIIEKPKTVVSGEETQYGPVVRNVSSGEETQYAASSVHSGGEETQIYSAPQAKTGYLVDNFGKQYQLSVGVNTIGRKASNPRASVQIDVNDLYMSRNHAIIEVRNAGGQMIHILKNGANQNPSYLNGTLIGAGDQMILNNGDKMKFGYTELTFKK